MSIIKKFIFTFLFLIIPITFSLADIKKVGKFKDWETLVIQESSGKVCFAQSNFCIFIYCFLSMVCIANALLLWIETWVVTYWEIFIPRKMVRCPI